MRSFQTSLLWSVVILLVITASANATRQLIDLGPGVARSTNDNGQIVGSSSSGYATLFDSTGGKNNINISPIISGSRQIGEAYSINNNGQVVGYINSHASAYLFDSTGGGGGSNLGNLPNYNYGTATGINDNGTIVGWSDLYTWSGRAVCFNPSPLTDLGTLGGSDSIAYAINNNGKIVGNADTISSYHYACLFNSTEGGDNLNLGTITGYNDSAAYSINNLDQIVGRVLGLNCRAVLFDSTGGGANINLGTLNDGHHNQSIAKSINDLGQIVGFAFYASIPVSPPFSDYRAVLFDSTGQGNNIDLNTLIAPSSWTLRHAYGINNNSWIVGDMSNINGDIHAFLLTPEPATVLLFAFGGVTILRKRGFFRDILRRK